MSVELLSKNHGTEIINMIQSAQNQIWIISPFIGKRMCDIVSKTLHDNPATCKIITRFYREDFIQNVSSLEGLQLLLAAGAEIQALVDLHTKLYIIDDEYSIVTSANFTEGGLMTNHELGIKIEDERELNDACITYFNEVWDKIHTFNIHNNNAATVTLSMIENEIRIVNEAIAGRKKGTKNSNIVRQGARLAGPLAPNLIEEALLREHSNEDEGLFGGWLKFEADATNRYDPDSSYFYNRNEYHEEKTFFPRPPRGIQLGDKLFLALVSYDSYGNPTPMIVGKAIATPFDAECVIDSSSEGWESWMARYPYYIKMYNIEVLDGAVKHGISLLELYAQIKGDIYPSKFGTQISFERIRQFHYQKDKIRITRYAVKVIEEKLEAIFKEIGSIKYLE